MESISLRYNNVYPLQQENAAVILNGKRQQRASGAAIVYETCGLRVELEVVNMKRKQIWTIVAIVVAVLLIAAGILVWQKSKEEEAPKDGTVKEGEIKTTAMYVPYGEDQYIMVDQEVGTIFTVTMPEDIYDVDGKKIKADGLEKGNILSIYGNGIMLESYPGQYPGVTKIEVVEKGKASDADQYQNVIDQIYQEPNPAEVPFMDVKYSSDSAAVTAMTTTGSYKWNYTDKEGNAQSVKEESPHILTWEVISDITLDNPTDITLLFSEKPDSIQVERWDSKSRRESGDESKVPDGEAVMEEVDGDGYILRRVNSGAVYLVTAQWGDSQVEYGFLTK